MEEQFRLRNYWWVEVYIVQSGYKKFEITKL